MFEFILLDIYFSILVIIIGSFKVSMDFAPPSELLCLGRPDQDHRRPKKEEVRNYLYLFNNSLACTIYAFAYTVDLRNRDYPGSHCMDTGLPRVVGSGSSIAGYE